MIIYFYLFIPLLCRSAESSSIKGRNHKNDLVPFLSSRLDAQKDNSLKIVSNEPFIIQFQMPPESKENVHNGAKIKDKKKKRPDKKRVSKIKPPRKKIRIRRDVSEAESRKVKPDGSTKLPTGVRSNQNQTQNFLSPQEMLKALNIHLKKKETKKLKVEEMRNIKDMEKTDATSSRNLHRNHSPSLPDREPHVKMIYPNTPKSDSHNYFYKDLIADRERLEQKINYIRNMLSVNDSATDDPVRFRRKSDSETTANKIAKMVLTLSAADGVNEKKSKCDDNDRVLDVWEKEKKKSPSRQSSSSNEERYKIKKWIEYMKSKRSSRKTCPCMNAYNEENDTFPLEQKLKKDYLPTETGKSSEERSDKYKDPTSYSRRRLNKSGPLRNSYKEDPRSKLRALTNRGTKKYDLPIDDLELYRSRAKQILQNAEEILDKIKEEEEKRLAAPHALVSRLRELTSRIQGDPRNSENDLINIIQKNLGWTPQSKSQPSTNNNSFVENMKSLILDPYEKAKALTDENTRKLSSYLLRNLGKIDSSEEEKEDAGKSDQRPQVFHGQVPQTEEMFSANLAKENPETDLLAKEREEHQNWSDTLSAILRGNEEHLGKENIRGGELKGIKGQEDLITRRMEEMIKEQEKKISEHTEKPETKKIEETTIIDLMTGEVNETPKGRKQSESAERVEGMLESEKRDENVEKRLNQNNAPVKESETVKSNAEKTESDVIASKYQLPSKGQAVNEEFAESVGKRNGGEGEDDKIRDDFALNLQDVKAAISDESTKEDDTVAKNLEKAKELKDAAAGGNQDEDVKDLITETGSAFEKGTGDEKVQALESPQKEQEENNNVQSKQGREENDVLNSKHLVQEIDERSEEDIQKPLEENTEESPEETAGKPAGYEGTIVKKEHDPSKTKDLEENVAEVNSSPDSVRLQGKSASKETQKESSPGSDALSTGVVQASQDQKESLRYDDSEKDISFTEKENSAEGLVESVIPETSAQSFVKNEKTEDYVEGIVEKQRNSAETEKENMDVDGLENMKSAEEESKKGDTLKSELGSESENDDEKVREELDDEKVREELDDEKVREELDDEKVREDLDDEKVREELDDEKVREELDDEKEREESDDEKVREESDDEKVREELDDEKVREELDDEKVREELDDEKVREESDDEKVREESDDEKVREELDDEKVRVELDDEKVREDLDDEKVREELDDEKVREESDDEKVREELDDEKVREDLDDEKVNEELNVEKVREELDDEKVREELDDKKVNEELNDEKVREELDDEKVREESDDEKVREELYDEKVREELDDEKVREESDDEKVREELDDKKVNEELNDEKVREELDDEKVNEELNDEKVREELDDEKVNEELNDEKLREELDDEKVNEELENDEMEILRENLDDAEQDETNQEEPFLKASSEESDNEQKSSKTSQPKSLKGNKENAYERGDDSALQSQNTENESLENSSGETSLKASKQEQEENKVDGTENDEVSFKASEPQNFDGIQDTKGKENLKAVKAEQSNQGKGEPQVRAELQGEETGVDSEESPLRSENPEKDTEISNESVMNTSGSQEKVEATHDETVREENSETDNAESTDETLKATADETDKGIEEIASAEVERVEQPKQTESVEENSREANPNEDESLEINKTPKLLMSIKENRGDEETVKANQEEENENSAPVEDTLSASEADDPEVESKNINEEVPVRAANSEAGQEQPEVVQDTQEMNEEDDVNVRTENIGDSVNQIEDEGSKDGELRSAKAESGELNEDGTLKVNSLERKYLDKDDLVEGVKQLEPETEKIVVGKKKNAPASEQGQSQSKSTLKVPKSIGKIMRDLDGKEKDDYVSLTNLNPEKIDHIIDKIDEAQHRNKVEGDVDCRKECACADEMNLRSRNIGRYEIAKDFLRWVKDLQLNRVLTDD